MWDKKNKTAPTTTFLSICSWTNLHPLTDSHLLVSNNLFSCSRDRSVMCSKDWSWCIHALAVCWGWRGWWWFTSHLRMAGYYCYSTVGYLCCFSWVSKITSKKKWSSSSISLCLKEQRVSIHNVSTADGQTYFFQLQLGLNSWLGREENLFRLTMLSTTAPRADDKVNTHTVVVQSWTNRFAEHSLWTPILTSQSSVNFVVNHKVPLYIFLFSARLYLWILNRIIMS